MALPFTDSVPGEPPTGEQSWTCFLRAANFNGPIAYYIPETWSKIGKLFNEPFLYGRGLDARPGLIGGGAMEINTVPRFDGKDTQGTLYSKIPPLRFPVDAEGRTYLVQDVTFYSKETLYDPLKLWRKGGPAISGQLDPKNTWKPKLTTKTTRYDQEGKRMTGIEGVFDTAIFEGNLWGLKWNLSEISGKGEFPQYFKHVGSEVVAVSAKEVPVETKLHTQEFPLAKAGASYTSPTTGAWTQPGAKVGPFTVALVDGSEVTYSWYRFVDQPSFQQYHWSEEKKARLQAFVVKLHANWTTNRSYIAPPSHGTLVALDPGLLVTPPRGLEAGYVPIVTGQSAKALDLRKVLTPEMLVGRYQCEPIENGWHVGELKLEGSKASPSFRWTNQAGRNWKLTPDLVHGSLQCEKDSPYSSQESGKSFRIKLQPASGGARPAVAGFQFNGGFYKRLPNQ